VNTILLIGRGIIILFTILSLGGAVGGLELVNRAQITHALSVVGSYLATPSAYDLFSYDRLLFLFVLGFASILIFESIVNRNRPITVLGTDLRVEFLDADGTDVRLSRIQYLRANHPNVTAYYMEFSTQFGGTIPQNTLQLDAVAGTNVRLRNHPDIPPTVSNTRLEVSHIFDDGMPFTIWNMLIPEFILRIIVRNNWRIPKFVVRREVSIHVAEEHKKNDTYYQATVERYRQRDVKLTITFNQRRRCRLTGGVLEAQLLKPSGVEPIFFKGLGGDSYQATFRKLQNVRVRVPFKF
jgi:hypothetical protein